MSFVPNFMRGNKTCRSVGQGVEHAVNAASLLGRIEDVEWCGSQALGVVGDLKLHSPLLRSPLERGKSVQNVSALEGRVVTPSTSRLQSSLDDAPTLTHPHLAGVEPEAMPGSFHGSGRRSPVRCTQHTAG